MQKILVLIAALLFSTVLHAATPSEASLDELMAAIRVEKMLDNLYPAMEQSMRQSAAAMTKGQNFTPKQQAAMDAFVTKMMTAVREEISWPKMRPIYVQIYQETFTQEEVDGLIAFYKSPAGIAYVNKLPVVMQKSMSLMQQRMGPMMEKMNAAMKQAVADAKAGK